MIIFEYFFYKFGGEIELRARLESELVSQFDIPVVMLLLGGGRHTVIQVKESIDNNTPCIFFDDTGKFSNVFSFILKKIEAKEPNLFKDGKFSEEFRKIVKERMIKEMSKINVHTNIDPSDEMIEPILNNIEYIFNKNKLHLLSYFEFKFNFESNDVDVAILTALFRALKTENDNKDLITNYREQLDLCIKWKFDPKVIFAFLFRLKKIQNNEEITMEDLYKELKNIVEIDVIKDIEEIMKTGSDLLKRYNEQLAMCKKWNLNDVANLVIFILKNKNIENLFSINRFSPEFKDLWKKEELNNDLVLDFETIFLRHAEKELTKRYREQLTLCLKWNRYDLAKKYILTYSDREKIGSFDNFMFDAIKNNRPDFVKDFLENGFILKNLCTYRMILKLYNTVSLFHFKIKFI